MQQRVQKRIKVLRNQWILRKWVEARTNCFLKLDYSLMTPLRNWKRHGLDMVSFNQGHSFIMQYSLQSGLSIHSANLYYPRIH